MRLFRPHATTRVRRAALLTLVVLGSALALPSQAVPNAGPEPGTSDLSAGALRDPGEASTTDAGELPTTDGYVIAGVVASTQGAVTRRSKMYITLGPDNPIMGILRYGRFNDPIENPTRYNPRVAMVRWPFGPVACATVPPEQYALTRFEISDLTPVTITDDGRPKEVGALPDSQIRLAAFGAIPASARLSMKLVRRDDRVVPLTVATWVTGADNFPGCSGPVANRYFRSLVIGQVEITLSDLVVDGVPVELGSSCRTSKPVDLTLWGVSPYIPLQGGSLYQHDGLVDAYGAPMHGSDGPLDSPYYQELNGMTIADPTGVDIPPFVGCGVGGDDLSPLVTAMASGPNNPVSVNQGNPMKTPMDPDNLLKCDAPTICPLPAPETPEMPPLPDEDGE